MSKKISEKEILKDLQRIFEKLGRPFTTGDYSRFGKFHRDNLPKRFGSFNEALKKAGLAEKFEKALEDRREDILSMKEPKKPIIVEPKWFKKISKGNKKQAKDKTIFIIPDLHFPFHDERYVKAMLTAIAEEQPTYCISMGDQLDFFSFSKFSKTLNLTTPYDEYARAKFLLDTMWKTIQKISPKTQCFMLLGNHSERIRSRLLGQSPQLEGFIDFNKIFDVKHVTRTNSAREAITIEGIKFVHGYFSTKEKHFHHFNSNVVFGHTHKAYILYFGEGKFEFNVGCGINEKAIPFSYTRSSTTGWQKGYGIIRIRNKKPYPEFIPYYEN